MPAIKSVPTRRWLFSVLITLAALLLSALLVTSPAAAVTPTTTPTRTATRTATPSVTYVVREGDQLLRIARQFGVTLSALKAANHLTSDTITPGQVLIIPPPAPTATPIPPSQLYTVQSGDQLLRIARQFGVTLSALKAANRLTSDTIQPGQVLIIPTATPLPAATRTTTAIPGNSVAYTVRVGDRLTRIAIWYGVTVEAIQSANKLRSDTIWIDQILVIPNPTLHPVGYTVQRGDTLTGLAARFELTIEAIKIANRMKDDTIYAGLVLIIPVK